MKSQKTLTTLVRVFCEGQEATKTSNSHSSAYMDTVEGELRSKSKRLAKQGLAGISGNRIV